MDGSRPPGGEGCVAARSKTTLMKAAWYEKQGAERDVITIGEMDDPQPLAGEVRITIPDMSVSISNYGPGLAERTTTL
jgi:hypothetical protein